MSKDQASSIHCFFMFVLITVGLLACWSVPAHAHDGAWFQGFETLSEHHDFEPLQAPCRGIPRFKPPKRIILDHDGAFEAYYAILVAALESQHRKPNIELIAVTLSAVDEIEHAEIEGIKKMDEQALALYKQDPEKAQQLLTTYCETQASQVVKDWWEFAWILVARYDDGYINAPGEMAREVGYPEDWYDKSEWPNGPTSYEKPKNKPAE